MDGNLSPEQAKILKAIKDGDLRKEDIEKGLLAISDAEMSQKDRSANMELVNAGHDLLHRMNYSDTKYVSRKTKSLAHAQEKLAKRKIRREILRQAIRIASVVLIVIAGGICYDLIVNRETLIAKPTTDEQQYEVTGSVVEGQFISDVQADEAGYYTVIGTSEMNAVVSTLGYVPDIPTWLPIGWEPADYYATASDHGSSFRIKYQNNAKDKYIKYSINRYSDINNAQVIFEQSKNGDACLISSNEVYITDNLDSKIAVWISNAACYSLSGPITTDELISIIESIPRSENHNAQ